MITACPGAPACTTGKIATREIARRLVDMSLVGESVVHVSGCAKGCAYHMPASLVLTGTDAGIALIRNGRASDAPFATAPDVDAALAILHGNPA
jgi:precorrin-3B synthase